MTTIGSDWDGTRQKGGTLKLRHQKLFAGLTLSPHGTQDKDVNRYYKNLCTKAKKDRFYSSTLIASPTQTSSSTSRTPSRAARATRSPRAGARPGAPGRSPRRRSHTSSCSTRGGRGEARRGRATGYGTSARIPATASMAHRLVGTRQVEGSNIFTKHSEPV